MIFAEPKTAGKGGQLVPKALSMHARVFVCTSAMVEVYKRPTVVVEFTFKTGQPL